MTGKGSSKKPSVIWERLVQTWWTFENNDSHCLIVRSDIFWSIPAKSLRIRELRIIRKTFTLHVYMAPLCFLLHNWAFLNKSTNNLAVSVTPKSRWWLVAVSTPLESKKSHWLFLPDQSSLGFGDIFTPTLFPILLLQDFDAPVIAAHEIAA